ncbi:hypothetical protein V6S63_13555 [Lactococcus lactis]|nr:MULTISPECIES: hypothetical protein [Lactococcus]
MPMFQLLLKIAVAILESTISSIVAGLVLQWLANLTKTMKKRNKRRKK